MGGQTRTSTYSYNLLSPADLQRAAMTSEELNRKVVEELKHIPTGSVGQTMLRGHYNTVRRHDLILNPTVPAKDALLKAIELVKKDIPGFLPNYDKDFFGTRTK